MSPIPPTVAWPGPLGCGVVAARTGGSWTLGCSTCCGAFGAGDGAVGKSGAVGCGTMGWVVGVTRGTAFGKGAEVIESPAPAGGPAEVLFLTGVSVVGVGFAVVSFAADVTSICAFVLLFLVAVVDAFALVLLLAVVDGSVVVFVASGDASRR